MKRFMHIMTGSVDTRAGWLASYHIEELERRNLSPALAFDDDVERGLLVECGEDEEDGLDG